MTPLIRKLRHKHIWRRLFHERLSEPIHMNLVSLAVLAFGSLRQKIAFDLVIRQQHAFAILKAADLARSLGVKRVSLIEFGVAAGAGLLNICKVAGLVTRATGVEFSIHGFDTGTGMPPPLSFRDHPELYQEGDFPMNVEKLRAALPANAQLILGPLNATLPRFLDGMRPDEPIGFVSVDVDYHSSSRDALMVLSGPPGHYLPRVEIYLDDVHADSHNSWCGERLAVAEFNEEHEFRKIEHHVFLRSSRLMKNAGWIDHMVRLHVLDHPTRSRLTRSRETIALTNPYL